MGTGTMSPIPVQLPTSVSLPLPKLPDDNTMMLSSSASTMPATPVATSEAPLYVKLLTAGTAACVADIVTFPLDTAKVRLQVQGEGVVRVATATAMAGGVQHEVQTSLAAQQRYRGLVGTIATMARQEGARSLYNGLAAGLQRQMCFASVRLGLYDSTKVLYQRILDGGNTRSGSVSVGTRIAAGFTTGALAVLLAQPTDVVKVRFQAAQRGGNAYTSTLHAYRTIARTEGARGLWKGTFPNVGRNAIVNVSEIVCYDLIKESILHYNLMTDNVPCHFTSAVVAGFCTTVFASPIDVVKTRYMNSKQGTYKGAFDCGWRMAVQEGPTAFYKGFTPSFCRLVSWNIVLWITYEQFKLLVDRARKSH